MRRPYLACPLPPDVPLHAREHVLTSGAAIAISEGHHFGNAMREAFAELI